MMTPRWMIGLALFLTLLQAVANASAEVTLKGNVLCNRATEARPWSWDPKDGDHTPILYAIEGTPEVAERVRKIMESYPGTGPGHGRGSEDPGAVRRAGEVLPLSRPERRRDPQGR